MTGLSPLPTLQEYCEATTGFALEPWQRIMAWELEALTELTGQRVLIHGPPQFGKSIIISQRFPSFSLGYNPLSRVRVACYNVSHAERFSKVNLALMRGAEYRRLFSAQYPDVEVPKLCPSEEWSTQARGLQNDANPSFKALGLGTGFTGLGVDTLVIDDPYKNAQEARSEAINRALWDWWTDVVLPRVNPSTNIVVMFHRWWEGDFAGRLLEQGGWRQIRFPAISDDNPDHDDPTRAPHPAVGGAVLRPAPDIPLSRRYPIDFLRDIQRRQGLSYYSLYQGSPVPVGGGMFKLHYFSRILEYMPDAVYRVRYWDKAATADGGDYTVGVRMSYSLHDTYVVEDVVRGQWEPHERDAVIQATAQQDGPYVIQMAEQEGGASGKSDAQAFTRLLAGFAVGTERPSGSKVVRATPYASQAGGGNVELVRGEWNTAYVQELCAFPNAKHDDQVDASSGAFNGLNELLATLPAQTRYADVERVRIGE